MSTMTAPSSTAPSVWTTSGRTSSTAAIRLTRRGRSLLVLTLLLGLLVAGMTFGRVPGQAATGHSSGGTTTLTVQPGESLWTVADRIDPHQDPRLVVAALESANGLAGPRLVAGQQLVIPRIG